LGVPNEISKLSPEYICAEAGMRLIASMVILSVWCLEAGAAEIRLNDGSVVVGTILRLVDGEDLVVDTDYMDEVTIEWKAIEEISGTQVVDIFTYDDRRFIGTVVFGEGSVTIYGQDETEVAPEDIFSIDELSDSFWDAVTTYTDLGMNIVRGNNQVTQVSFGAGIGYEGKNFETALDVSSIVNEQAETERYPAINPRDRLHLPSQHEMADERVLPVRG
jgi:hypothetical protein